MGDNVKLDAVLGKTLTEILSSSAKADVLALGNKLWDLRKWVYNNADQHVYEISKDKQQVLGWIAEQVKSNMPEVNSIEYNFGAGVTDVALRCFVHAKHIEGIDKVMEESSQFKYVDSFHDRQIVLAYLKVGAIDKAEGVVNYLNNVLKLESGWAARRAKSNQKLIDSYKNPLYFFLITPEYVIGTPAGIAKSEKTVDILFDDFAKDTGLQEKLKLLSVVLAKPDVLPPLAYPLVGEELKNGVATYLAAFYGEPEEKTQKRDYLRNNGLVRILVIDDKLRQEIKSNEGGVKK